MSDIFCGVGPVPKGKRRGTMKECVEQGQIRYYGIKKVDQRLLENALKEKKIKSTGADKLITNIQNMTIKAVTLGGKIKKLNNLIKGEKDAKKKKELEKELEKTESEFKKIKADIAKAEKQKNKPSVEPTSKTSSKTSTKPTSKTTSKTSTKPSSKTSTKPTSKTSTKPSAKKGSKQNRMKKNT
jgi:hypothetical protein